MGQEDTGRELVALTTPQSALETEMLQDLLWQEHIPALVRDAAGVGGYMKIYMGYSVYGETIYVQRQDLARAQELLQGLRQAGEAAVLAEQSDACADADAFEEMQQAAAPPKRQEGEKPLWPVALICITAILIALLGLRS